MRKLFQAMAVIANITVLIAMVAFGAFHITEAQAEQQIQNFGEDEIHCLRQNVYFEAGNQSMLGKRAVAWVTLNRVIDDRYPDSICGVVKQGKKNTDGSMVRNACQFSWHCDGKADSVPVDNYQEKVEWNKSKMAARSVLRQWILDHTDPTGGADHYHASYVSPSWSKAGVKTAQIDDHIFYQVAW